MWPLRAAQPSLYHAMVPRSGTPTLYTALPTSLPASTSSKMNFFVREPTTPPLIDATRTRPLAISYPHPTVLLYFLSLTPTPTPTLTPTPTPTPTPTQTLLIGYSPYTDPTSPSRPTLELRISLLLSAILHYSLTIHRTPATPAAQDFPLQICLPYTPSQPAYYTSHTPPYN